ncbi:MAG TPA: hypothetical protein VFZ63_12675 [Jiangellaceae bacterium]
MAEAPATNTGPGRVLVAVYALFAVAATARSGYQIATRFDEAPVPFLLSAFAGVVYLVATVALARPGPTAYRVAVTAVLVELAGVLIVGAVTAFGAGDFPRDTVWSDFGRGYGFIPLVLPFVGLWWLRRSASSARS